LVAASSPAFAWRRGSVVNGTAMRVLIVEDEEGARKGLELLVSDLGLEAKGVATLADAFEALGSWQPDVCLTDMVLPDGDGLDFIRAARAMSPPPEVVALTGHGSVKVAVEAMKAGAYDYLLKPLKPVQLEAVLRHLTEKADHRRGAADPAGLAGTDGLEGMVGRSEVMREVFRVLGRVARSDAPVMLTGESGTGRRPRRPRFTGFQGGGTGPWSPSTAAPCRRRWSRASCSATRRARSPARTGGGWATSRWPGAGRSSSTRSPRCRPRCR